MLRGICKQSGDWSTECPTYSIRIFHCLFLLHATSVTATKTNPSQTTFRPVQTVLQQGSLVYPTDTHT